MLLFCNYTSEKKLTQQFS